MSTERSDKVSNALFDGKIAIIVNGSPFVLILPAVFLDFLKSPEDDNLNYVFSNFLRMIRLMATFFAIFLPGIYVAITNFHQELLPSELLFAIASSFSTTVGIIGALILRRSSCFCKYSKPNSYNNCRFHWYLQFHSS